NFEVTPILEPLKPFRNQLLVLSGVRGSWPAIHSGASTSFLTGTSHGGSTEIEVLASTSIDQLMAAEVGKSTQLAPLEVSTDNKGNAGQCSANLSCTYVNTISWRNATTPLPMENDPRAIFERLFGDSGTTDPEARSKRIRQNRSILDSVAGKVAALKQQ